MSVMAEQLNSRVDEARPDPRWASDPWIWGQCDLHHSVNGPLKHIFKRRLELVARRNRPSKLRRGDEAMWSLDSYRDLLSERIRPGHVVLSAWFVVAAVAVSLLASA